MGKIPLWSAAVVLGPLVGVLLFGDYVRRTWDQETRPFRWSIPAAGEEEEDIEGSEPAAWESSFCEPSRACEGVEVEEEELNSL